MTHEELVEKVGRAIWDMRREKKLMETVYDIAGIAIAAVAEALKEPTPEMVKLSISEDLLMKYEGGMPHWETQARKGWQAMLAASPLYPKEAAK